MKIKLIIDVNELPKKVTDEIVNLLTSCWVTFMYIGDTTIEATFDLTNFNSFANGMANIKRRYNLQ